MSLTTPAVSQREMVGSSPAPGSRFLSSVQSPVAVTPRRTASLQRIGSWQPGSSWQPSNPYIFGSNILPREPMSQGVRAPEMITTTGSSYEAPPPVLIEKEPMSADWRTEPLRYLPPMSADHYGYAPIMPTYQTSCQAANVLVVAIQEISELRPLDSENPYVMNPNDFKYELVPFATGGIGDRTNTDGYTADPIGPITPVLVRGPTPGLKLPVNTEAMRIHYDPDKRYFIKVLEMSATGKHVLGVVALTLGQDDPDIPVSLPNVPAEHVINHPTNVRYFILHGADSNEKGCMVVGLLFDYLRPGETLWPSPEYYAKRNPIQLRHLPTVSDRTFQHTRAMIAAKEAARYAMPTPPVCQATRPRREERDDSNASWIDSLRSSWSELLNSFTFWLEMREMC